jgi:nitrogen regulatory protein P-II 1
MIKIEAVVRPERVNVVVDALVEAGCGGYHVANVTGKGIQQGVEVFTGRGATTTTRAALPKTIVTTVVSASLKDTVVTAIIDAAKSGDEGQIGDGKIFVSPISEVIRVRTGEKNDAALTANSG